MPHKRTLGEFPAEDFMRDERVQRALRPMHINRLRADFDIEAIGAVLASERKDGSKHLIDGGHRVTVMIEEGLGHELVPAVVYHGLTLAEEARLFLRCNYRASVEPLEKFRLSVASEDPESMYIAQLLEEADFSIHKDSGHTGSRAFYAIHTLQSVYRGGSENGAEAHPEVVRDLLRIIMEAWGEQRAAVKDVVLGLGILLLQDGPLVDQEHLVRQLSKLPNGVSTIQVRSKYHRQSGGLIGRRATRLAVLETYNKGLPKNKQIKE